MFEKKWEIEPLGADLFDVVEEGEIIATISGEDRAVLMVNTPEMLAVLCDIELILRCHLGYHTRPTRASIEAMAAKVNSVTKLATGEEDD